MNVPSHLSASWNLQDAKAKLSELVDRAATGHAQVILRRGQPAAAVVSIADYERLGPRETLISFLLHSPLVGSELDIPHDDAPHDFPDAFSEEGA